MLNGKAVLVVDDEAGIRLLATRALIAAGCSAYVAEDGNKAIRILDRVHIDLALVDIIMPNKEGIETIMEMRLRWPEMKIISMSGGGYIHGNEYLKLSEIVGADKTVGKPLRFKKLIWTIESLLAPKAA